MKKALFLGLMAVVLIVGVTACGTTSTPTPAPGTPATPAATAQTAPSTGTTTPPADMNTRVATLEAMQKGVTPGTAWYMLQLEDRMSRVWFDVQAKNWNLANFDVDEMGGADRTLIAAHATRKDAMTAFEKTYFVPLTDSIKKKDNTAFTTAYDNTIKGCNECHVANVENNVSFGMIKITRPTSNPITNQDFAGPQ
jgi:hypothetical protein